MTMDQLRQRLAADGLSFDEFRSNLREEITVQRLRQRFAQSRVQVSEAEIDRPWPRRRSAAPSYRLAHILVDLPDGATPEQIATAQREDSKASRR